MTIDFPSWKVITCRCGKLKLSFAESLKIVELNLIVNMSEHVSQSSSEEAREALASIEKMQSRGSQVGVYPRWFALAFALWGAALAFTIETVAWPVVFIIGLVGYIYYRQKRGVWIKEIQSKRDFWVVISRSVLGGLAYLGAYVGLTYYGLAWAPYVAGVIIFVMLYTTTEMAYGKLWAAKTEGEV